MHRSTKRLLPFPGRLMPWAISLLALVLAGMLPAMRALAATCAATVIYNFDDPGDAGADTSGNGYDATIVGPTDPGFSGRALRALGSDGVVEFQATVPPLDNHTGDITGFAWVKPQGPSTGPMSCNEGTIFRKGQNFWPQLTEKNEGLLYQNEGSGIHSVSGDLEFGVCTEGWSHVAFTRSGTTIRLYHNGVEVGAGDLSALGALPIASAEPLTIGSLEDPTLCEFNGLIDSVSVHPCAFTENEIAGVFASQDASVAQLSCCAPLPADMVGWWKLENADPVVEDELGKHDGALDPSATSISGVVGGALEFGGGRVVIPNDPELDFGLGDLTIDAWVKTAAVGTIARMPSGPDQGILFEIQLFVGEESTRALYFNGVYGPNLPFLEWSHVAVVLHRGTSEVRFFLNGVRTNVESAVDILSLSSSGDLYLGEFSDGLDEVEIFNRALTDPEILSLYRAGNEGKCGVPGVPTQSTFGQIALPLVLLALGMVLALAHRSRA